MTAIRAGLLTSFLLCLTMASCTSPTRLPAVPSDLADKATVLNLPSARSWEDSLSPEFLAEIAASGKREHDWNSANGLTGPLSRADYLAISGGGANGAYGAGILCGWTSTGSRPRFKVVTGISTGALTAPFAFMGSNYDDKLRKVYTSVNTNQIASSRGLLAAIYNDALMDTAPLCRLVESLIDDKMLADIATEYSHGRLLLVATTNLDSGRAVIWNVGAIAATATPEAYKLIRDILVASAAIPAAFPPVMVDVEIGGHKYQEMHVDGGATAQVFLYPPNYLLKSASEAAGIKRERRAYIIRNARLDAHWADVQRRTLSIAGRAIDSLIQTQGVGDLYRIYLVTKRDEVGFNLAYIPKEFDEIPAEDFDPIYMSKLFDVGYKAITTGNPWTAQPPTLVGNPDLIPETPSK